jgi:hypothetical protein
MPKKLTTEEWIARAKEKHGDKYDYSKSIYTGSQNKITVTCPEHGDFEVIAQMHVRRGDGCHKCASLAKSTKLRLSNEEFINRLYNTFGDKYDYSKVRYTGNRGSVTLICPNHGEFNALVSTLSKGVGCLKCKEEERLRKFTDTYIQEFKKFHPELDYSKTVYTGWDTKVTITCPKHGDFEVLPGQFHKYVGCPKCSAEKHSEYTRKSLDDFLKDAKYVHGERYDYSKVNYAGSHTKICILCPEHGEFWQTPASHIQGEGCPSCSSSKGEGEICNVLLNEKIKFVREYTIQIPNEINTSGRAHIDFYLPEHNTFIEYNGIQHYEPEMAFGGTFKFEQQQARDEYVRQYCKDNDIKLIEIRYDEDVWEVLNEKLLNNNDK